SIRFLSALHQMAGDGAEAAALALEAGIDVELPNPDCYAAPLREALARQLVTEDDVDVAVGRVLKVKESLGLLDGSTPATDAPVDLDPPEHRALARTVAEQSMVVMKNDGVLPLDSVGRVAVVGPLADSG